MKYSDEVTRKVIKALKQGVSIKGACGYAGISTTTYYEWLRVHEDFRRAVDETQYYVEQKALKELRSLAKDNWRVWTWLLERRFPDQWGNKIEQKIDVNAHADGISKGQQAVINMLEQIKDQGEQQNEIVQTEHIKKKS